MSNVIPFPSILSRVDLISRAIAEQKGPRELIEFEAHHGAVCLRVAGLELWMTPQEARDVALDMVEASMDAEGKLT